MSKSNIYKVQGKKMIPVHRFNLAPAKPSISFNSIMNNFAVIMHPVVSSINLKIKPKEDFPIIESNKNIEETSSFKQYKNPNTVLCFPEIEILPDTEGLFYYENVLDEKAQIIGFNGKVMLKYRIQSISKKNKLININLKEAILNLKIKDGDTVKINGDVNTTTQKIVFKLKDEAVKIAFHNLTSRIDSFKPHISLFFDFTGYSKPPFNSRVAMNILSYQNLEFYPVNFANTSLLNSAKLSKRSMKPSFSKLTTPLVVITEK